MKDIKSMTLAELGAELKVLGEPAFRAKQIYRWMHRGVRDFSEMTDISRQPARAAHGGVYARLADGRAAGCSRRRTERSNIFGA